MRLLRDRTELFEEGDNGESVIKLGRHRFSVNTQPLELTLLPRGDGLAFHLTGTDFSQPADDARQLLERRLDKSPDEPPRILIDEVERSPYKELTEGAKGPLSQINIRTEGDHLADLSKRSNVVAALKTYKAFRLYHADGDEEARKKIMEIVDAGISKWPA